MAFCSSSAGALVIAVAVSVIAARAARLGEFEGKVKFPSRWVRCNGSDLLKVASSDFAVAEGGSEEAKGVVPRLGANTKKTAPDNPMRFKRIESVRKRLVFIGEIGGGNAPVDGSAQLMKYLGCDYGIYGVASGLQP